jgi:hypothetical protein
MFTLQIVHGCFLLAGGLALAAILLRGGHGRVSFEINLPSGRTNHLPVSSFQMDKNPRKERAPVNGGIVAR